MVTVNFSSAVRAAANGDRVVKFDFDGDINSLLKKLITIYGEKFENRLLSKNQIKKYVNVYVNGTDIRYLNHQNTSVKIDDVVDFIPSVAGG